MSAFRVVWLVVLGVWVVVAFTLPGYTQLPLPPDAGTSAGRYSYTASSLTVTDLKTGLVWQKKTEAGTMTLAAAQAYCSNNGNGTLADSGWRLPTIKELLTLVDYSKAGGPRLDQNAFPGTIGSASFWSSSLSSFGATWVLTADFNSGGTGNVAYYFTQEVRCVR